MRQLWKGMGSIVVFCALALLCGAATGKAGGKPNGKPGSAAQAATLAAIEGRLTVVETINRTVGTHPLRHLTVYLFSLDQSKPLQELQHKCRKATALPGGDTATAFAAYNVCVDTIAAAVELVPHLTAAATTRTDADGNYKFEDVPPARRYQVVAVKVEEGEPIIIVGLTLKLRAGQRVTIDLRENDPWTNAAPL